MPKPGTYAVAVSGGVDSMALLDILRQNPDLELVVAHLDHGIRKDSAEDRKLVEDFANKYGLKFVYKEAKLGPKTSESKARGARYQFLNQVVEDTNSKAIITAHHQDDLLETAIINLLRGTGRKGLTSLNSDKVIRPLLRVPKSEIIKYAKANKLSWREDSTNADIDYLRNYVRHKLLTQFDEKSKKELLANIQKLQKTNRELDTLLVKHLHSQSVNNELDRVWFNQLPHDVAREIMASWLRLNEIRNFDRPTIERLVVAAKTADQYKTFPVTNGNNMKVNKANLALDLAER